MLNIFFKDLKQNLLLIFTCILLPFLASPISYIFFKEDYEDAKFIIYILLLFIFIPLYLIILSSSIYKDENLNLIKQLPITFNKLIFSKILFIIFNYFLLTFLYFSFLDLSKKEIGLDEILIAFFIHSYSILTISFISFSFSNLFEKSLRNFLVYSILILNIISFYFVFEKTNGYMLLDIGVYLFYLFIFAFSLILLYFSSKYIFFKKEFSLIKKIFFVFIFLIPSIYLFSRKDYWIKGYILSSHLIYPISEEEIFLKDHSHNEIYSYNIKTKKFKPMNDLLNMSIRGLDEDKLYLTSGKSKCKVCSISYNFCQLYYSYDFKNKKIQRIGTFPFWSYIHKNIVFLPSFEENKNENKYTIKFINREKDKCFSDFASQSFYLKDGIIYKKREGEENKIYYAKFENGEKIEILKGDWDIFSLFWYFGQAEGNYAYLKKDKKYYKILMPEGKIIEIGNLFPLIDFQNDYLLALKTKTDKKILCLLKEKDIIKEIEFPFNKYIWSNGYSFLKKYGIIHFADNKKIEEAIVSIENNDFKLYYLPDNIIDSDFLKKEGEIILRKQVKFPLFGPIAKAYIYNFKTGKERKL